MLAMGHAATAPDTLAAFDDLPVLVIGNWGAQATDNRTFILSNPTIADLLTVQANTDVADAAQIDTVPSVIGSDMLSLEQFGLLRTSLAGVRVVSSAAPARSRLCRTLY